MGLTTKKPERDRSKIDLGRPIEVRWWTRALDVSREDLIAAVEKVGDSAAAVRKELERLAAASIESEKQRIEKTAECAREARHQAALLPEGRVKDALMDKAKGYEAEIPEDQIYK
jgi:hypothetical protein